MAERVLHKPVQGARVIVASEQAAHLVLDFTIADATLERSGNDLIFHFDDGSNLVLRDFYVAYTKDSMPDFIIEGTSVSGEQFFAALNEPGLMPAAGPSASPGESGGRFHEFSNAELFEGVDRLGGLDLGLSREFDPEREPLGGNKGRLPEEAVLLNPVESLNLTESGVYPGGNNPDPGIVSMSGKANGNGVLYGFLDAEGNIVSRIVTQYGMLKMTPDGMYSYVLDNALLSLNSLALGEIHTERFTVVAVGADGKQVTQELTVTIHGTNDRPELSFSGLGQAIAEGNLGDDASVSGTFAVADPDQDAGQSRTFLIAAGPGTELTSPEGSVHWSGLVSGNPPAAVSTRYGTLTLQPSGTWTYTLNNDSPLVQQLNAGETRTETFTVTVIDEHGANHTLPLSVTITGTNDVPVIGASGDFARELKEQGVYQTVPGGEGNTPTVLGGTGNSQSLGTVSGKITATDVDTENGGGSADQGVNGLIFGVRHQSSVLVTGTQQDAVSGIGNAGTGSVAYVYESSYGTLLFHVDGTYTYTLKDTPNATDVSNAVNHLALGQTVLETFTVTATDAFGGVSSPQTITITIHGTNDRPELSLDAPHLNVIESGVGRVDESTFVDASGSPEENTPYTLHGSASGIAAGLDADAGHILYYGVAAGSQAATYDPTVFNTADSSAGSSRSVTASGVYGALRINADGSYAYTMRSESDPVSFEQNGKTYTSLNQLNEGDQISETFTIYVRDEYNAWTAQTVTVTLHGTNDIPMLRLDSNNQEITQGDPLSGGAYAVEGTFAIQDVDQDAGTHQIINIANGGMGASDTPGATTAGGIGTGSGNATYVTNYGTLTVYPDGRWDYRADPDAVKGLGAGETKIESFNVTIIDEHGASSTQTLNVLLTGINGAPVLVANRFELKEEGVYDNPTLSTDDNTMTQSGGTGGGQHALSFDGQLSASDEDLHDVLTYGISGLSGSGGSSLDVPVAGRTPGAPALVTVQILSNAVDADTGIQTLVTNYGTLTLNMLTGTFTFDIADSRASDSLAQGESLSFALLTTVSDSHGGASDSTLSITIKGTNDRPELTLTAGPGGAGDADGGVVFALADTSAPDVGTAIHGTFAGTDADRGANLIYGVVFGVADSEAAAGRNQAFTNDGMGNPVGLQPDGSVKVAGTYGTLVLTPDGKYSYTTNSLADKLAEGQNGLDTFTVYVRDEHGAWTAKPLSVAITGANDTPTLSLNTVSLSVVEAGVGRIDENTFVTTPGPDENKAYTLHGSASGTATGTDVDNNAVLTYGASLGSGVPLYNAQAASSSTSSEIVLPGTYGKLTLHSDGFYTYTLFADGATNALNEGQQASDTFTLYVQDEHGAWTSQPLEVTVQGTNDRPVLWHGTNADGTGSGDTLVFTRTEDNSNSLAPITGQVIASDADSDNGAGNATDASATTGLVFSILGMTSGIGSGSPIAVAGTPGTTTYATNYGTLVLDPTTGSYTFTPNEAQVNKLGVGQSIFETFTFRVMDVHGAYSDVPIKISIAGTNDAPVISKTTTALSMVETGVDAGNMPVGDSSHLTGSVGASDVDNGDRLTYFFATVPTVGAGIGTRTLADGTVTTLTVTAVSGLSITTDYGTFTLNAATGKYGFVPAGDSGYNPLNQLNLGDTVKLDFSIGVKDNHGELAQHTHAVTVTINGSNDAPFASVHVAALKEEGVQSGGNTATAAGDVTNESGSVHDLRTEGQFKLDFDYDDATAPGFGLGDKQFAIKLEHSSSVNTVENQGGAYTASYLLGSAGDFNHIWSAMTGKAFPKELLAQLNGLFAEELAAKGVSSLTENVTIAKALLGSVALATFTVQADGSYVYALADSGAGSLILNMLGQGYVSNRTLNYTVTDPHGGIYEGTFQLNLYGTNDRPTLELQAGSFVSIDGSGTATLTVGPDNSGSGIAFGADADAGHVLNYGLALGGDEHPVPDSLKGITFTNGNGTFSSLAGEYGTLTITIDANQLATYTYRQNTDLVNGKVYTDQFIILVKDEYGAWTPQKVNVSVTGSPDAPVLVRPLAALVTEITEAGVILGTNIDVGAKVEVGGQGQHDFGGGLLGSFAVQQSDFAAGHGNLIAGFVVDGKFHTGSINTPYGTLTATVTTDNAGKATVSYFFVMPVEGTPEYAAFNKLTANDRIKLFDGLKVSIYDNAQSQLVGADTADPDGVFTIADTKWLVSQNTDLYIHGTNDRPFFTASNDANDYTAADTLSGAVKEHSGTFTGQLYANDFDNTQESLRFSVKDSEGNHAQVLQGTYGILTIDQRTGAYTYVLNEGVKETYRYLNPGQQSDILDSFRIEVRDPNGAWSATTTTLSFSIQGEDDITTIASSTLSIREDSGVITSSAVVPESGTGTLALKAIDAEDMFHADGGYAYTQWVIKGTSGANITLETVGGTATLVGGTYGHLELISNGDGTWSYKYVLDQNNTATIQSMAVGETKPETFTVTATNDHGEAITQTISVTIRGTNDAPEIDLGESVLTGAAKAGVFEAADQTSDTALPGVVFTGSVKGTDIDHAATAGGTEADTLVYYFIKTDASGRPQTDAQGHYLLTQVLNTEYGSFVIDPATGAYVYKLDQARVGGMDLAGESESVQVVAVDIHKAQSAPVTITINLQSADSGGPGPDIDKLLGNSDLAGTAQEDGGPAPSSDSAKPTQSVTGQLNAVTDTGDAPDRVFSLVNQDGSNPTQTRVDGDYGFITINPSTGNWTYTLYNDSDAVQRLGEGQTVHEKPFYIALDGTQLISGGAPVTIDITVKGTNDVPEISGYDNITLSERVDGSYAGVVTGSVIATDIDTYLDASGTAQGGAEQAHLIYTITDSDGNALTVTNGHVQLMYGTVAINTDGSYTYTVGGGSSTLGHLPSGSSVEDDFYVTVTDPHDAKVTQKIDVTIDGVNHAPTVTPGVALEVTEDATSTVVSSGAGNTSMTDDKNSTSLFFSTDGSGNNKIQLIADPDGYGTLQLKSDGSYTFTLNNQSDRVQGLGATETVTRTFTFWVHDREDGTKQVSIDVNIHGTNDQPIASVDRVIVMDEGGTSGSTSITASDTDIHNTLSYGFNMAAIVAHNTNNPDKPWTIKADGSLSTEYGTYRIDTAGSKPSLVFEIDNTADAVIALADKQLVQQTVTIDVSDDSGTDNSTVTVKATINLQGENSAPVHLVLSEASNSTPLPEDSSGTFTGVAHAVDLDTTVPPVYGFLVEGKIVQSVPGTYGTMSIDKDTGEYTYTLHDSKSDAGLDALPQGYAVSDAFQIVAVDATDSTKVSSPQTVTVHIEGQNDAPVITRAVATDTLHGTLSFSDVDTGDTHGVTFNGLSDSSESPLHFDLTGANRAIDVYDGGSIIGSLNLTYDDATHTVGYAFAPDAEYQSSFMGSQVHNFTVSVTDAAGASVQSGPLSIEILGTNTPPSITEAPSASVDGEAHTYLVAFAVNDAQGDALASLPAVSSNPEHGTVTIESDGSGGYHYIYTLGNPDTDVANDSFTITVTDVHGASSTHSITVPLTELIAHDPPISTPLMSGTEAAVFSVGGEEGMAAAIGEGKGDSSSLGNEQGGSGLHPQEPASPSLTVSGVEPEHSGTTGETASTFPSHGEATGDLSSAFAAPEAAPAQTAETVEVHTGTSTGNAESVTGDMPLFMGIDDGGILPAAPIAAYESTSGGEEASSAVSLHEIGNALFGGEGMLDIASSPGSEPLPVESGSVPVGLSEPGSMPGVPQAETLQHSEIPNIVGGSPIVTESGSENDLAHQIAASQVQNGNG